MSLSDLQQRVATLVFSLAEAEGFALAEGGALIAHEVVDRTTRDLDYFGPSRNAVDQLWPAIRDRLLSAGLEVELRQSDHGFVKTARLSEARLRYRAEISSDEVVPTPFSNGKPRILGDERADHVDLLRNHPQMLSRCIAA